MPGLTVNRGVDGTRSTSFEEKEVTGGAPWPPLDAPASSASKREKTTRSGETKTLLTVLVELAAAIDATLIQRECVPATSAHPSGGPKSVTAGFSSHNSCAGRANSRNSLQAPQNKKNAAPQVTHIRMTKSLSGKASQTAHYIIPAASSLRTPPWPTRTSPRSRASASDPRGGRSRASTSTAS